MTAASFASVMPIQVYQSRKVGHSDKKSKNHLVSSITRELEAAARFRVENLRLSGKLVSCFEEIVFRKLLMHLG